MLARIRVGSLRIELPDGTVLRVGAPGPADRVDRVDRVDRPRAPGPAPAERVAGPSATIRIADWRVFGDVLSSGDIGFGEGYMRGDWSSPGLSDLLRLLVANRDALEAAVYGRWWGRWLHRLRHLVKHNTRAQARRNIRAHYDLGNAFYRLWLDPSMTYSSALFEADPNRSLQQAQQAKYERVLRQLGLSAGARVLEIGCGWGGLAERAAASGLHLTGLTLSREQHDYAATQLARAGLADRVRLLLQDYRDTEGRFDGIASIEMFEAVGEAYWPDYFSCLKRNLAPGGRAVIQTIVIDDALFERYRSGTDFIQQYVFPGGMLASDRVFGSQAQRSGLRIADAYRFGGDYARTLAQWREAFTARLPDVRAQGFDEPFLRMWEFYLAYCEAGFAVGNIDVVQYTLEHAR
ncbi:MAG: class I SAM-dependent methyltransferase [Burkholderiales bacterium]|nr:MAG: class I SAM-dependent methyltransferase [Burkholderiales bacterium]